MNATDDTPGGPGASGCPFVQRIWRYQLERFPLHQHAPLIAAFSYSALCFSCLLRVEKGDTFSMPGPFAATVSFVACLGFFFQLRVADEFKDFDEDLAHRPYRPVQRGLVTLKELLALGVIVAAVQATLAWLLHPELLVLLGVTWAYFLLMSREFFVRRWLQRRPIAYLASHMAIMPLIDLFATGCDWVVAGSRPSIIGLGLFLAS
ncbi:MAG: UbiA family prenyltransferase, partial [Planctomycetota bacterium]